LSQGKVLGAARLLDADLTREAMASILVEDGLTTSAIEGERLDPASVRSSVARRLGLPTAGLPVPPRAVDETKISRATAYRELADLVAKGCLRPTGKGGRSSGYEVEW
jgi:Fic family protein